MRGVLVALFLVAASFDIAAQSGGTGALLKPVNPELQSAPAKNAPLDLPVRKVVLYKNGVGYFEHAGTVQGSQRVAIDFTSSQLNDVLQSLTVLDQGGGRISGVDYNSTTPIEQQLRTLALGLNDYPATLSVYQALRGQRVEVTGAGAPLAGRLVNIEFRKEVDKNGLTSEDHYFLIVASDTGALRTAELTDAVSVRMLDASLQKQFEDYLEIVSSAQNQQLRHLTLEDRGTGERQLQVSYISEVPVWKSTYRMVFPREANGSAIVQGWAVVDNTVGADWDNVQLSLVAGAPQSFIQPLSQPIYTRRPEIPIATAQQSAPETHEAAEMKRAPISAGPLAVQSREYDRIELAGKLLTSSASESVAVVGRDAMGLVRGVGSGGGIGSGSGNGFGPGVGGNVGGGYIGGVYRGSDAIQAGDISANAFDDFFEYALAQPVTIHKNESAMVPILEQELPAEHVTLWSDRDRSPLRAVWLENKSRLTLDSGSFSIFENGEFAGEGLLDPIHPGEKRLLSYAVDQAVKVHRADGAGTRRLHHVAVHNGVMVQTTEELTECTYTVTNAADEARTVIVEHGRRQNAKLESETKPAEVTADAYRFRVAVDPHQSVDLRIAERAPVFESVQIDPDNDQTEFLVTMSKYTPDLEARLKPLIDAETALSDLNGRLDAIEQNEKTLTGDEVRDRDNVTALKGNDAAKRFVDELNRAEDALEAARKDKADLEKQRDAARAKLESIIAGLSFDADLDVTPAE